MLSRIFWIGIAGVALLAGMAFQDGSTIFSWGDKRHESAKSGHGVDVRIDAQVDRAIDRSFEKMQVTGPDGREVEVPVETKRELASAVGRLVKAETDLALLRMDDGNEQEIEAARNRVADARADIDRLKTQITSAEQAARAEHEALREQIRRDVQENVRATVREAVRN